MYFLVYISVGAIVATRKLRKSNARMREKIQEKNVARLVIHKDEPSQKETRTG